MIQLTGSEWDEFGRLVLAVSMVALIAYLVPGMMALSPAWAHGMQLAAIVLLTLALILAAIASVAWFVA